MLHLHHVVIVVDLKELMDYKLVVWLVRIVKRLDVLQDLLDLLDALGRPNPQLSLGILQALGLDVLHLDNCKVTLLPPLQLLIQEVQHGKVETPHVITSGQIHVIVSIEAGKRDGSAEVSILTLSNWLVITIKVLFSEAEVHDINLAILTIKHEVASLDISMNEATFMYFLDGNHHFDQNLDGYLEVIALLETASCLCQVNAKQVHHDEVLFVVLNILIGVRHMLQT